MIAALLCSRKMKMSDQYVFSAFGTVNFLSRADSYWHMKRCSYPSDLFEMELQIQSMLEFENLAIPAHLKESSEK